MSCTRIGGDSPTLTRPERSHTWADWCDPEESDLLYKFAALLQQSSDRPPRRNGLRRVMTVLQRIAVAQRRAGSGSTAMHPTAALSVYRGRPAWLPAPGPGSASGCVV